VFQNKKETALKPSHIIIKLHPDIKGTNSETLALLNFLMGMGEN